MLTLPFELTSLIVAFAPLFSKPVWKHAQVLLTGAMLAPSKRTVTSALRVRLESGAALSNLSSRLESCAMVFAGGEPHPALVAHHELRADGRTGFCHR
jgi:hypothetical protein